MTVQQQSLVTMYTFNLHFRLLISLSMILACLVARYCEFTFMLILLILLIFGHVKPNLNSNKSSY